MMEEQSYKRSTKPRTSLIIAHQTICCLLSLIIYFGHELHESLNIVKHPLTGCKAMCCLVSAMCFVLWCLYGSISKIKVLNIFGSVVVLILGICIFYTVTVLYGAPLYESSTETFHLVLLVTCCSVLPCCLAIGPSSENWHRVFFQQAGEVGAESGAHIVAIASVVGTWVGAFPIPLDWDRPWQVWPITCVIGCLCGHTLGHLLAAAHLIYHKRRIDKLKMY